MPGTIPTVWNTTTSSAAIATMVAVGALTRATATAVPQAATATTVSPLTIDQNDPNSAVLFTSDSTGPMSLMA